MGGLQYLHFNFAVRQSNKNSLNTMLIPLGKLQSKYNIIQPRILHVGAHLGEERGDYQKCGSSKVVWIEANPELASALIEKLNALPMRFEMEEVIHAAVAEIEERAIFNVASNDEASSLLELGTHQKSYPSIQVEKSISVTTRRIENMAHESPDLFGDINFVNLDIQGMELGALKGMGAVLDQVDWIYTEVNRRLVYQNCALIWDLDSFLLEQGFERVEVVFTREGWGDAFYIRRRESGADPRGAYLRRLRFDYFLWKILETKCIIFLLNKPIKKTRRGIRKWILRSVNKIK